MAITIVTESNADLGRNNMAVLLWYESMICAAFTLIHWSLGGFLYGSESARVVYGDGFVSLGGYLVFMGFVALLFGAAGMYASRFHNRAVLLFVMVLVGGTIAGEVSVAVILENTLVPLIDPEIQRECLTQSVSEEYEDTLCADFFVDNRTLALWNLWELWTINANDETNPYTFNYQNDLLAVQAGYSCCGFSRPQMCRVNRTLAPSTTDVYVEGSVASGGDCGEYWTNNGEFQPVERWYPPTEFCDELVTTFTSVYLGGCPFDLPYGSTCIARNDFADDPDVKGCAQGLEDYINSTFNPVATVLYVMVAFQAVYLCTLLCYFFKRKMVDVTPVQGWQKFDEDEE